MIIIGDDKGRLASYNLVLNKDEIKSIDVVNEFKGFTKSVKSISVTLDH